MEGNGLSLDQLGIAAVVVAFLLWFITMLGTRRLVWNGEVKDREAQWQKQLTQMEVDRDIWRKAAETSEAARREQEHISAASVDGQQLAVTLLTALRESTGMGKIGRGDL